ncbi:MAG TPA: hypothetical protein VJM34_01185 [Novosphingobium sp.]|nr:hypothetical protein [Novosphingobium sp.]
MTRPMKFAAGALLLALGLALSACLLAPGKFVSDLDIRTDGTFRFSYRGEMHLLPLSEMARQEDKFAPQSCYKENSMDERPCTKAEIANQKREWQEQQASNAEKKRSDAESAKAFLGGIDPSDPKAAQELADRLRKQKGWRRVDYRGNGLFDVDFAISGTLDHDFAFPTIERFPFANAFVQIAVHQDGTVRIDAPSFGPGAGGSPFGGMMQAAALANAAEERKGGAKGQSVPVLDGVFTIRTDGEVLANNTDAGPKDIATGKELGWTVNTRTVATPTALIRLAAAAAAR